MVTNRGFQASELEALWVAVKPVLDAVVNNRSFQASGTGGLRCGRPW
jgi:hypothetical protein